MTVRHVLIAAAPGDATTTSAFETRDAVATATGEPGPLFARFVDPALADQVLPLRALATAPSRPGDVVVLHASIGDAEVFDVVTARRDRLVVVYHNVSPPEAFAPWDGAFAALLERGRAQIAALAPRCDLAVTPSAFNARDLQTWGYRDIRVIPLVVDTAARLRAAAGPSASSTGRPTGSGAGGSTPGELAGRLATGGPGGGPTGGPRLLFVGQLHPHKRPELLVQACHVLATYSCPSARLTLAGPHRLAGYAAAVRAFAHELRAPVELPGAVPDGVLAGLFRDADVFVTASDHEGFCAPLLEAMAFGLPVVARACGAVPEVAGDAALLVPAEDGPLVLAEAVEAVVADAAVRDDLVARGRRRLAGYDPPALRARLGEAIAEVAG